MAHPTSAHGAEGPDGSAGPSYVLFQRKEDGAGSEERYEPVGSFPGREPTVDEITRLVPRAVQPMGGGADAPTGDSVTDERTNKAGAPEKPNSATDKFAAPSWD